MGLFRGPAIELGGGGWVSFIDARGADTPARVKIEEELKPQPADIFLHLADDDEHEIEQPELDNLATFLAFNPIEHPPKIIGVVWPHLSARPLTHHNGDAPPRSPLPMPTPPQTAPREHPAIA